METCFSSPWYSGKIRVLTEKVFTPRRICGALALFLLPLSAAAFQPVPFEAEYQLFRNGKLKAHVSLTFGIQDAQWSMHSESKATRGFEKLLRIRDVETAKGSLEDGRILPLRYQRETRVAGRDLGWNADYDWDGKKVRTRHKDGDSELDLAPGVYDPLALGLVLRVGLANGEQEWRLKVVDEDKIKDQLYRAGEPEELETALGCIEVRTVERIRENSSRYTRSIHAAAWDFLPLGIEYGKRDGDQLELRITSLKLDGEQVEPGPGCQSVTGDG